MIPPTYPMTPSGIRSYARLLINRTDTYLSVSLAGHWARRRQRLTYGYLLAALKGEVALGLYSVDAHGLSRWVCLDLDDGQRGEALWRVAELLPEPRQALLEASRRGWHLWLLVKQAPWAQVRAWARHLAVQAGLGDIEVFPKGEGLNGVRAPLTPHPKDGQIYPLIDVQSGEIVADPLRFLAARRPQPVPDIPESLPPTRIRVAPERRGNEGRCTEHAELVAEVERYTQLRFYGPERAIGRCPFHDDLHPSLGVIGGFWRCWAGCGQGGLAAFKARARRHERR